MRAMAYDAYGSDDVLTLRELPDPKVGPGEVRIRVRRAGVSGLSLSRSPRRAVPA